MIYFLYTIFFISCVALIVSVLLQPGKTDAGALFTSNISSSAFGPRGTATVLSKITIVAASLFMLSALFIAMPALQGNVSVLNANPEAPIESTQPPITDLNANTATNSEANAVGNVAIEANTSAITPANTSESNVNK
ncbi:MAG: preprotein translocase subunit SecG [Pyrinomonadaceae bacterium]|nr:preprotein translocase subunit SecG [Pyrinomonadaceae bacterium]